MSDSVTSSKSLDLFALLLLTLSRMADAASTSSTLKPQKLNHSNWLATQRPMFDNLVTDFDFELGSGSDPSDDELKVPRPDMCPRIYVPVCGLNGHTYINRCRLVVKKMRGMILDDEFKELFKENKTEARKIYYGELSKKQFRYRGPCFGQYRRIFMPNITLKHSAFTSNDTTIPQVLHIEGLDGSVSTMVRVDNATILEAVLNLLILEENERKSRTEDEYS